jgi:hypothetical protein
MGPVTIALTRLRRSRKTLSGVACDSGISQPRFTRVSIPIAPFQYPACGTGYGRDAAKRNMRDLPSALPTGWGYRTVRHLTDSFEQIYLFINRLGKLFYRLKNHDKVTGSCFGCHMKIKAKDFVFSQKELKAAAMK